jgi:hypothetical protein
MMHVPAVVREKAHFVGASDCRTGCPSSCGPGAPEYDLGISMREDPCDGDLRERARRLAGRTGLDKDAIWGWGVVERVSTGLLGTRVGLQPVARDMLAAADEVAD